MIKTMLKPTDPLLYTKPKSRTRSRSPIRRSPSRSTTPQKTKDLKSKKDEAVLTEYKKTTFYPKFSYNNNIRRIKRVGIIPYVNTRSPEFLNSINSFNEQIISDEHQKGGGIWFAMGVDIKYMELTDFGGFIEKGENVYTTANRELIEESVTIFDLLDISKDTVSVINNSPCVVYTTRGPIRNDILDMCTVFVDFTKVVAQKFDNFPMDLHEKFQFNRERIIKGAKEGAFDQEAPFLENYTSYWIPSTELIDVLSKRTPFTSLKKNFHNSMVQSKFSPLRNIPDKPTSHPYMYEKVRIAIFPNFFKLIKQIL